MKSVFMTCLLVAFFVTMSSFATGSTSVSLGSELKKGLHNGQYTALTDVFPRSGELVIVEANESGSVDVIKQLETR